MILLQATPLSLNFWVAILEAILLLALAAYIGWWIARRMLATRISGLITDIAAKRRDLDDCRRRPIATASVASIPATVVAAVAAPIAAFAAMTTTSKPDDLKVVEGIGPKIEGLLNDAGINTFAALALTTPSRIKEILEAAGPRFQMHDPGTWTDQAAMARDGKWDDLKVWQDELNKGRLS